MKRKHSIGAFVVLLGALFYCYEYFLRITPSVMQPELMRSFKIDATLFGALSSFYYFAYTPMQLIVGILVDRFNSKNILTLAIISCASGSLLFCATHSYYIAAFGRFLQGFGSAFAFVGSLKLASRWLPAKWFPFFSGICVTLGLLGAASGDIILTHLVQTIGWRMVIIIFGAIGMALAAAFYFSNTWAERKYDNEKVTRTSQSFKEVLKQFVILIKNPYLWAAGIIGALLFLPTIVFADLWGLPYIRKLHGYNLSQAGFVIAMFYIGEAIGSPLMGLLSKIMGRRLRIIWIGSLLSAICAVIALYMPSLSYSLVCVLFFAIGMLSSVGILTFVMGNDVATSQNNGMAIAFINFLVMLSGVFMQRLVGWLIDLHWSGQFLNGIKVYSLQDYQGAIAVIPMSFALASLVAVFVKERAFK
ncbi:MAG: MFS transporter [Gammaproteobacteria bacterium]|nr:MFS transporter [Gammaproteobacteria bacterium]